VNQTGGLHLKAQHTKLLPYSIPGRPMPHDLVAGCNGPVVNNRGLVVASRSEYALAGITLFTGFATAHMVIVSLKQLVMICAWEPELCSQPWGIRRLQISC